jgi:hypothetical protein
MLIETILSYVPWRQFAKSYLEWFKNIYEEKGESMGS